MASVFLNGNLKLFAQGNSEFEINVKNIKQVFEHLVSLYPELKPHLLEGVAVAIDGEIYQDAWLEKVHPDSEVHLIPRIGGG